MRILAIRLENIASLAGRHDVLLTEGPLEGAGLFAIAGPTGSGKTTLLDAMCLALYGTTPRAAAASADKWGPAGADDKSLISTQDPRTLLHRGAGAGWAEVDFEGADGRRYQARWSVNRAREKATGKLQKARHQLVDLSTGDALGSGKPTDTQALIAECLGLTFDQFCRSVLLAQGEFAAFLKAYDKAGKKHRADLLEKMTGTRIYRDISRATHARCRVERETLATLQARHGAIVLLSEEERAALTADLDTRTAEAAALGAAHAATRAALGWHQTRLGLEADCARAVAEKQAAAAAVEEAAPRRTHLALVKRAAEELHRPVEDTDRAAAADLAAEQVRLEAEAAWRLAVVRRDEAATKVEAAVLAKDAAVRAQEEALPALRQAQALDAQLAPARATVAERRAGVDAALARAARGGARPAPPAEATDDANAVSEAEARALLETAAAAAEGARQRRLALQAERDALPEAGIRRHRRDLEAAVQQIDTLRQQAAVMGQARADLDAALADTEARCDRLAAATRREAEHAAAIPVSAAAHGEADRALRDTAAQHELAAHRVQLADGEPCPLCGATEHPWAADESRTDAALATLLGSQRERVAVLTEALAGHRAAQAREQARRDAEAGETRRALTRLADQVTALGTLEDAHALAAAALEDPLDHTVEDPFAARLAELGPARVVLDEALALAARLAQRLADAVATEDDHLQAELAAQVALERARLATARGQVAALEAAREALLGGQPVADVEAALAAHLATATRYHTEADAASREAAEIASRTDQTHTHAMDGRREAAHRLAAARAALEAALAAFTAPAPPLALEAAQGLLALDRDWTRAETEALGALDQAFADVTTRLADRQARLAAHLDPTVEPAPPAPPLQRAEAVEALTATEADQRAALASLGEQLAAARHQLAADDRDRARAATAAVEVSAQQVALTLWTRLDELIGAEDGSKLPLFAQQLTFEALLEHANVHLAELSQRYRLERNPFVNLELQIVDRFFADEVRPASSLSGGETFLVSLALALGLASLSSRSARIGSLFVDEGFGSLDPDTLEVALEALEQLRASGRQIGLISHVEGLAERIGARVEVVPSGGGVSTLRCRGPGDAAPA